MKPDLPMIDVLRLTRSGKLGEATSTLQAMLQGRMNDAPPPAHDGTTIDITPTAVSLGDRGEHARSTGVSSSRGLEVGFLDRRHVGAGGLDYLLYVPADAEPGQPVVVMLHGCTQSPEDFARGTRMNELADEFGVIIVYPRQTQAANAQRCWNWFKPGDQQRDRGEPALITGIVRDVVRDCKADPARVYVAGLSAGGAAAANLAARYTDLFAAVGIHSGLACGAAHDLPSALAAMQGRGSKTIVANDGKFVPTITFHGDRDRTVAVANSAQIVAAATRASHLTLEVSVETGRSPDGRSYTRAVSRVASGRALIEQWTLHGAGHAWSGGDASGSYTDPSGPDASRQMLRFFLEHRLARATRVA